MLLILRFVIGHSPVPYTLYSYPNILSPLRSLSVWLKYLVTCIIIVGEPSRNIF